MGFSLATFSVFFGICALVKGSHDLLTRYEAETGINPIYTLFRANMSNNYTVPIYRINDYYTTTLCLDKNRNVTVTNIGYSNHEGSDNISVSYDNYSEIGYFQSEEDYSIEQTWSVLRNSSQLGSKMELRQGPHDLKIMLVGQHDDHGIELDFIELTVDDMDGSFDAVSFWCGSQFPPPKGT
ncbi:hypothetical protein CHS0354_033292 [Potamilus streckersoni]|uniref:Uncharacterized protein n=1 Tax=Potamilus streckersoni TaxID=2493646 RepID=A0AAE0VJP2_9BIVA|nr:hypothetical protein CHS0354_033292 [Potamilus streckersoni]